MKNCPCRYACPVFDPNHFQLLPSSGMGLLDKSIWSHDGIALYLYLVIIALKIASDLKNGETVPSSQIGTPSRSCDSSSDYIIFTYQNCVVVL